tara:strand:- start:12 stop:359 length:348 start_codon:yes stop_codon:yes gene_type:complete
MNKSNKNLLYAGVVLAALAYFFRDKSEVSTTDSATNDSPAVETSGGGADTPTTNSGGSGTPATSGGGATVETSGSGTGTPATSSGSGTPTSGGGSSTPASSGGRFDRAVERDYTV